jgi:hypothetical protein
VSLDSQRKLREMKKNPATLAVLQGKYDRLRQSLARTGPISDGSVLHRSPATSGRSGYQWTRKVAGKTVAVALSQPQFAALQKAVANERKLWKTIKEMEKISRQIIFRTMPDTHRRKPLSKKALGLI